MKKETRVLPMARINTRIRPEQHKYIKSLAKKHGLTEGEIFRSIIDAHMSVSNS